MAVKPALRLSKPSSPKKPVAKRASSVIKPRVEPAAAAGATTTTVTHTCLGPGSQEDLVDRHFRLSLMLTCCSQPQLPHLLMRQLFSTATANVTADQLTDLHFKLSLGRHWPLTAPPPTPPPTPPPRPEAAPLKSRQKPSISSAKWQQKHRKRSIR
ncbi:hypothetical protein BOX15_Mlig010056g2 [Macrostomum lignano]|uniref:Uncharacterized protein n=2 Tax=Macrostomum lignano TaxID=282301 RepID=A0A267ESK9_9PLAT|nr:hypothetical protein BOX15_Mlig010056g2 [Macrostomum lignano]